MSTKTALRLKEDKGHAPVQTAGCPHHWLIDPPESRTSNGECMLCRARRTFPNYLSDCLIENDREKYEEWLVKQGRKKAKNKGSWDILAEIEEGM